MSSIGPSQSHSCVRCFERKVKCDKRLPCSGCLRSKVECVFRVPPAPRRTKKRSQKEILLARLTHCEDLLQQQGIDVAATPAPGPLAPSERSETPAEVPVSSLLPHSIQQPPQGNFSRGNLIVDQGKSQYFENKLWSSVSEELQRPHEALAESSSEDESETVVEDSTDFLLGFTPLSHARQDNHPPPDQILKLWQLFLERVDPMTKMIHRPTLHQKILKASSSQESITKSLGALMYSIYSGALTSITDRECEMMFGEPRKVMLSKYRQCTRMALAKARFLGTSDIVVLQAFVLYLLIMREVYDARTIWTLAGVASRIAQSLGIHRDGTTIGLPPFETEMRRRLWWQISMLDSRFAELTGSGRYGDWNLSNALPPTNVNDEDIWPGMEDAPLGQTRPTEIVACLIRCEPRIFWKEKLIQKGVNEADYGVTVGFVKDLRSPWEASLGDRDQQINELERRMEEKFLRYCDVSIPIQFLASIIGRGGITSMRLMAHHPKSYEKDYDVPVEERRLLWDLSMKMLEMENLAHSSKILQRYLWHTNVYFPWHALIYVLGELRKDELGEAAENAWTQVEEVFQYHPTFITESKKPLHVAVGSLCLKAYDARIKALEKSGGFRLIRTPDFIEQILEQRRKAGADVRRPKASSLRHHAPEVVAEVANQSDVQEVQQAPPHPPQAHMEHHQQHLQTYIPPPPQQPQSHLAPMPGPAVGSDWQTPHLADSSFDPTFTLDFLDNDTPMDWTQWDKLIQDWDTVN